MKVQLLSALSTDLVFAVRDFSAVFSFGDKQLIRFCSMISTIAETLFGSCQTCGSLPSYVGKAFSATAITGALVVSPRAAGVK